MIKYSDFARLQNSFPSHLAPIVESLGNTINIKATHPIHWGYHVCLNNEMLHIPLRLYWDETILNHQQFTDIQQTILACILTRHHNGYIRERYTKTILSSSEYWVMPFIIQLLGEYIVEILDLLLANFEHIHHLHIRRFIQENTTFWAKTKQRIDSYWDCYYKYDFPFRADYSGFKLIDKIERNCNYT